MADIIKTKLISELPIAQVFDGGENYAIYQDGVTRKASTNDLINFTKKQDFATWVYAASSRITTKALSSTSLSSVNAFVSNNFVLLI